MSNLRIYIAIATFHPMVGGAEKQALLQACGLRARGYRASIITFHHKKSWLQCEVVEGVPVCRVAGKLLGSRERLPRLLQRVCYLLAMIVMTWRLWQHRHHYDILHVYQLNLLALPAACVSCLTGKPLIVAVRSTSLDKDASILNSTSLLSGPLDSNATSLKADKAARISHDLGDLERFGKPVVQLARFLLLRSHAIVVVLSSRMKEYLAAYNFNMPDVQLIPNGVDTTRFYPKAATDTPVSMQPQAQTVVCVSRLSYEKGTDVLLQAWYLVQKQMPQSKLIIVGDGPLRFQLERMVQELGIANSIEFTGVQSDILAQLHRGTIAILPSRHEGMPNAVLEAMACGLPCVATRVSGSEDIIQQGVNGLLVEIEDYQSMAHALLTLLRDPPLVQKYGEAARRTIEQRYSLEHIIDSYVKLYAAIGSPKMEGRNGGTQFITLNKVEHPSQPGTHSVP